MDELNALLANLPNFRLITDGMKQTALGGALIPDASGVWPGQEGYVETHDVYFAALQLLNFLRAQPVVRSSSSEGTAISVDAPNWDGLIAYYRSMSPVVAATGNGVLSRLTIPDIAHVKKVSMRDDMMGGRYGDVDTDVS